MVMCKQKGQSQFKFHSYELTGNQLTFMPKRNVYKYLTKYSWNNFNKFLVYFLKYCDLSAIISMLVLTYFVLISNGWFSFTNS